MSVTKEQVLSALRDVQDPDLHKDIVTLGFVKDVKIEGHAIEFRINAEDPYKDFAPSPMRVEWVNFPGGHGVRVDTHVYSGYQIPPHYDSMIGKIIVRGDDRGMALARMARALNEFMIEGPATTVPLGKALVMDERFKKGKYNTRFLESFMRQGFLGT